MLPRENVSAAVVLETALSWRLSVKVGDLIRHPDLPSLGVGLVIRMKANSLGISVLWSALTAPTVETNINLEIISERS